MPVQRWLEPSMTVAQAQLPVTMDQWVSRLSANVTCLGRPESRKPVSRRIPGHPDGFAPWREIGHPEILEAAMLVNVRKTSAEEAGDQDRLMALLAYIVQIVVPLVILLTDMRNRSFQRYHAVHALALQVSASVILLVLSMTPVFGLYTHLLSLAVTAFFIYCGIVAYHGNYFEIPAVTDFVRRNGWI